MNMLSMVSVKTCLAHHFITMTDYHVEVLLNMSIHILKDSPNTFCCMSTDWC